MSTKIRSLLRLSRILILCFLLFNCGNKNKIIKPVPTEPIPTSLPEGYTFQSSMKKVIQNEPLESTQTQCLYLSAAKNEYESIQLVITAPATTTATASDGLKNIKISITDFIGESNAKISSQSVQLFLVSYIYLPYFSAYYPDPLPPYREPFSIKPGEHQSIWILVYVPKEAEAGKYYAIITVAPENAPTAKIRLNLKVWNFTLPNTVHLRSAFGIWGEFIAEQHHCGGQEYQNILIKYYESLLEHKISAYSLPVDIKSPEAEKYFNDPRFTSFVIPYSGNLDEMRETVDFLRSKGWLEKGFFYPLDEPRTEEDYNTLKSMCIKIHSIDPNLKITSPFYTRPYFDKEKTIFDYMVGYLNLWCVQSGHYDNEEIMYRIKERQDAGEEAWWYVCVGPSGPYANFFVHQRDGIKHRILFWQMRKYNITGLLYWATTYWNAKVGTADPWTDIATIKDINPSIYGDGSLFYPGSKIGIDGPVSSQRLEIIRDGFEDYEYLWMLEEKFGSVVVENFVDLLVTNMTVYVKDWKKLSDVREQIAELLEE